MVPIIKSFMSPVAGGEAWQGSDAKPHSADDIKSLKSALVDGQHVDIREGETIIKVRQGPESHKRTAPFGVLLSVVSVHGENSQLAKKIDRGKWIYLVKSGDTHDTYASFHQYRLPEKTPPANPISPAEPVGVSRFAVSTPHIATKSLRVLSYGGGMIALQSLWRITRHAAWLRHPIMIPIVVAVAALAGLTPTIIAGTFMESATLVGGKILLVVKHISATWLGDPWFGSFLSSFSSCFG